MSGLFKLAEPLIGFVAKRFQNNMKNRLAPYGKILLFFNVLVKLYCYSFYIYLFSFTGLKYDDIRIEFDEVQTAISRADPTEILERLVIINFYSHF